MTATGSARAAVVQGGVTAPLGYRAAGIQAGIKTGREDMALIVSDTPAAIAGVFTTNKIKAAPVRICQKRLQGRKARAIIVNSGNANACTGRQGVSDAETMAQMTAECLRMEPGEVFVCSTGVIGVPLPMEKIKAGIRKASESLSREGGATAARAIMTTDKTDKQIALRFNIGKATATVGGMAKGSGMIAPNMATMLAFITTDAAVSADALQACLSASVEQSFNRIVVDGDQSTNDTVLMMANSAAGNTPLKPGMAGWTTFSNAVNEATRQLAMKILADGEGVTKAVTVIVEGAASAGDARRAARAVSNSMLVKTSWYGADPNWGRVMAAIGYSGAKVAETKVDISYNDLPAVRGGMVAPEASREALRKILLQNSFSVKVNLNLGSDSYVMYAGDFSEEYVRINASYTT